MHIIFNANARRKGPIAARELAASKRADEAQHFAMLCIVRCVAVTAGAFWKKVSVEIVSVSSVSRPMSRDVLRGFFPLHMKENAKEPSATYSTTNSHCTTPNSPQAWVYAYFQSQTRRTGCVCACRDAIDARRTRQSRDSHARFGTEIRA